ncbi:MAG: hypothetical protein DSY34_05155 [Desulfurobacterium sp.]|nr:MAG: hypothetical protein DSY34_05155 [Desulfurobacterium sp.]
MIKLESSFLNEYRAYVKKLSKVVERGIEEGIFKKLNPEGIFLLISSAPANIDCFRLRGFIDMKLEEVKGFVLEVVLTQLLDRN